MQSLFGGHLVILSMLSKSIEKIYKESILSTGGVSFNTNDSMVATGNKNGDIMLRNMLHPEGDPINKGLDLNQPHQSGIAMVVLSHFHAQSEAFEVTQVRFSFVKRHVLASAYANGQIVIWDTTSVFAKPYTASLSATAKKFVFPGHDSRSCTGISFSQVNHLLLSSCGADNKVQFYDITQGKEVKKIDLN